MAKPRISLYNQEGGADKVYSLGIEKKGDLYTVEAQWGRRGGPQQCGTKTPKPVDLETAEKVYDKTLSEKLAKGYHEGVDAPSFSQVDAEDSGLRPMLLTDDSDGGADPYIKDDAWGAQQKLNGKRIQIKARTKGVVGSNKRGLTCPIPKAVEEALSGISATLDGELIGDVYHAFDILEAGGRDLSQKTYAERHKVLLLLLGFRDKNVVCALLFVGNNAKRELMTKLSRENQEGIVFKKLDGKYLPGRVEDLKKSAAVKVKFYKAVSAVVIRWKTGKQSVEVGLLKGKEVVSVGWVTVPTKYVDQIVEGKPVRVKYLYATTGQQLFQAHLDATDDGVIMADQVEADPFSDLKYEGKEDES